MPIANLTNVRRLPRLGKIRLGIKVKNKDGVEYPRRVDYFVCPEIVKKVYGEKPQALDVVFPIEDESQWCAQFYKCYSRTQGLVCRGDGETATRLINTETGDMAGKGTTQVARMEMTCEGRKCPDYQSKQCKEVMNLQFLLPKVPGIGVWQIDTGSINSIININSCIDYIRGIFGRVRMIPLSLLLKPKEVQNPEDGKRQTIYFLHLDTLKTLPEMVAETRSFQTMLSGAQVLIPRVTEKESPEPEDLIRDDELEPAEEPKPVRSDAESPVHSDGDGSERVAPPAEQKIISPEPPAPAIQYPTWDELKGAKGELKLGGVDLDWVEEQVGILQKRNPKATVKKDLLTYIEQTFNVTGAKLSDALKKLSPDQGNQFCKYLYDLVGEKNDR